MSETLHLLKGGDFDVKEGPEDQKKFIERKLSLNFKRTFRQLSSWWIGDEKRIYCDNRQKVRG